jgi:hypothetical protein
MMKKTVVIYMAKIFIHTSDHDMKLVTLLPNPDDSVPSENCQDLPWSPSSLQSNLKNAEAHY